MAGTTVTNPKTLLGSSLDEDFGFRDNLFYNIELYVALGTTYDMTRANPRREATRHVISSFEQMSLGSQKTRR